MCYIGCECVRVDFPLKNCCLFFAGAGIKFTFLAADVWGGLDFIYIYNIRHFLAKKWPFIYTYREFGKTPVNVKKGCFWGIN